MRVRKLDQNGDMQFGRGRTDFLADSVEAVAQRVLTRLRLWVGEWFLDVTSGTDYQNAILGVDKKETAGPEIQDRILNTPGVSSIDEFESNFDENSRKASFSAKISTIYGETELRGIL